MPNVIAVLARDSVYAEQSLSVTQVDQSKRVEVRTMQLSQQSSPFPLVFAV